MYYYVQWCSLCVLLMNVNGVGQNVKIKTSFEYTFFQYSYVYSIHFGPIYVVSIKPSKVVGSNV